MPIWSDSPPQTDEHFAYRILRTPADRPLTAIVTCPLVEGCPTHYTNNRTVPCEGQPACQICEAGGSWRWHGYVSAVLTTTMEHILFEFTATASDTFRTFHGVHSTLVGCSFRAWRPNHKTNGRVVVDCKHADVRHINLPPPPNIRKVLCHIWGIPYQDSSLTTGRSPADKRIAVDGNGSKPAKPITDAGTRARQILSPPDP